MVFAQTSIYMNVFASNKTGFVPNMTVFGPNMTVFAPHISYPISPLEFSRSMFYCLGCPADQGDPGQEVRDDLARGGGRGLRLRHQLRALQVPSRSPPLFQTVSPLQALLHVLRWKLGNLRLEVLKLLISCTQIYSLYRHSLLREGGSQYHLVFKLKFIFSF